MAFVSYAVWILGLKKKCQTCEPFCWQPPQSLVAFEQGCNPEVFVEGPLCKNKILGGPYLKNVNYLPQLAGASEGTDVCPEFNPYDKLQILHKPVISSMH